MNVSTMIRPTPGVGIFLLVFGMVINSSVMAEEQEFGLSLDDFEELPEWKEAVTDIPPYPDEDNLLAFPVAAAGGSYEFFLDENSIKVEKDGIVRYTAVIRSRGGAENVFFEGIDCKNMEYKTYAYGQMKKTFRQTKNPQWKVIQSRGVMAFRAELHQQYFCLIYGMSRTSEQIMEKVKGANQFQFQDDTGSFHE